MTNAKSHVILAHDSFTQLGGGERVALAMAEIFPDSPMHVLATKSEVKNGLPPEVQSRLVTTTLQKIYNIVPRFQYLLPFIPLALALHKIPACRVFLSSSSGFAKGFKTHEETVHIDYCHTPTRFLWTDFDYIKQEVPWVLLPFAKIFLTWFKRWDKKAADRVDMFVANSREVAGRIQKFYNKPSVVIYPFVETKFWRPSKPKQSHLLIAGRLQAHKGYESALEAAKNLGLSVRVVGTGRHEEYLKKIAGSNVVFLGRVSDEQLRDEYSSAKAFLYPQLEDFGLMPLEASLCGTPTVALAKGGSLETVLPGTNGVHFGGESGKSMEQAITECLQTDFTLEHMISHGQRFSREKFQTEIIELVEKYSEVKL